MAKQDKLYAPASPVATSSSRAPRRQRHPSPSPSSSLLAIFATVAASSSLVDGHPLPTQTPPPEFLCPQLGLDSSLTLSSSNLRHLAPRQTSTSASASNPTQEIARSVSVADKYVSGTDGLWRKTDVWTLYGSTFCSDGTCSSTPTATSTTFITESGSFTPTPASTSDLADDIDILPSGWLKETHDDDSMTPIIITLSVVLAVGICTFIAMCVWWRRKRVRRLKDPERKGRKLEVDFDLDEDEKQARSQQRLWARATARWKTNVRQSARRRRKRQAGSIKDTEFAIHSSTTSLHRLRTSSSSQLVRSDSSSVQHYGSTTMEPAPSSPHRPPSYLSPELNPSGDPEAPTPAADAPSQCPDNAETPSTVGGSLASEPLPYEGVTSAGHVATDDKAVLARMAALASSPIDPSNSGSAGASTGAYASVPPLVDDFEAVLYDIQVTDFDADVIGESSGSRRTPSPRPRLSPRPPVPRDLSPCPSLLPPPPSKGSLAAPTFYEYLPSFEEDVLSVEPEMGPSAPPFEAEERPAASAPPLDMDFIPDGINMQPSAPPLEDYEMSADPTEGDGSRIVINSSQSPTRGTRMSSAHAWHVSPPQYLP
ncbi:uncharacterized protein FIBRA_00085 [Fibroporia radiculosa]|uniref:Uncharacterized protein n=1 Tax=Fibroporia radiculosa TaxID=599839 RepID=J7SBS8_9APHY|nr:uncharacterized protein FIBRA_00085 [Fibroporia radiculosa]CCL98091.1 predicted protein [Fibroporia radiculosa]